MHTELRVHSSREHFHTYLQSLDVERHGLHEHFRERLAAVFARYGVSELDRTPELEEAVFRIFLAQRRAAADVHLVSSLLQRWIVEPPPSDGLAWSVREVLDRLVRATQLRFPVVGDLARSVRFRWFDHPLVDRDRSSVLAGVRGEVAALADDDAPDRAARIDALAAIPEQIVRFLAERLEQGVPTREPMLEVLVRRHYREFDLHGLRVLDAAGRPSWSPTTCSTRPGRRTSSPRSARSTSSRDPNGPLAAASPSRWPPGPTATRPSSTSTSPGPARDGPPEATSEELSALVVALPFAADVRRIAVAVCPGGGEPVNYFTFRPEPGATASARWSRTTWSVASTRWSADG